MEMIKINSERVKVDFLEIKPKIIKLGKTKIEIKPFISAKDILIANRVCLKEFFRDVEEMEDRFVLFPEVRIAFDTVVLNNCTNIDFNGVKYDDLLSSGIMDLVRKSIFNYEEAFNLVLESIRLKNVECALGLVASSLPTEESMNKTMHNMSTLVKDMKDTDPELFKKMLGVTATAQAKKDNTISFIEEKEKIKAEKAKNNKSKKK